MGIEQNFPAAVANALGDLVFVPASLTNALTTVVSGQQQLKSPARGAIFGDATMASDVSIAAGATVTGFLPLSFLVGTERDGVQRQAGALYLVLILGVVVIDNASGVVGTSAIVKASQNTTTISIGAGTTVSVVVTNQGHNNIHAAGDLVTAQVDITAGAASGLIVRAGGSHQGALQIPVSV